MNDRQGNSTLSDHRAWVWLTIALTLFMFASIAIMSVLRYRTFLTGMFDLGNISQAIWSVTQGRPLELTGPWGTLSRMSWHVELIFFPIAGLYALFPSPETLLVLQALIFAAGVLPVYRLAQRRLEMRLAGFLASTIYLFYPVALTAELFDFHADTLAIPTLLFAIEAFDRRAWRGYGLWILVALGAKIYIAAPVLALGFVIWWLGERRAGIATMTAAIVWGLFALFIIQPQFAPAQVSDLGPFVEGNYFTTHFGSVSLLPTLGIRLVSIIVVLLPVILLVWRAWVWLLPALIIILPAALSSDVDVSRIFSHHYALAVPFLIAAVVYGAVRFKEAPGKSRRNWLGDLVVTSLFSLILSLAIVDNPLKLNLLRLPLDQRLEAVGYYVSPRDSMRTDWLAEFVPGNVSVLSSPLNATHLINRHEIYTTDVTGRAAEVWGPQVKAAAIDGFFEIHLGGYMLGEQENIAYFLENPDFRLTKQRDGMLLFTRESSGLVQDVEAISAEVEPITQHDFDEVIGLVSVEITQAFDNHYILDYVWTPLQPLSDLPDLFVVTRIDAVENARYLHLPTWALLPTSEWEEGMLIHETVEITIPDDVVAGEYSLLVSWYDSEPITAVFTDEQTRVGEEFEIGIVKVP